MLVYWLNNKAGKLRRGMGVKNSSLTWCFTVIVTAGSGGRRGSGAASESERIAAHPGPDGPAKT